MIRLNWKLIWRKAKLDTFDVVVCVITGLIITLLVIVASLTGSDSTYAIKQTLGETVNQNITNIFYWLDSFEMANSAVTFLFWGGVGFVLYVVVSSLINMSKEVSFEHDLSSDEYVHPASKSRKDILVSEMTAAGVLAVGLAVLIGVLAVVLFVILPALIINARAIALQPNLHNAISFTAATLVSIVGLSVLWLSGKLCMHRRLLLDT